MHKIILYYKYVQIEDPGALVTWQKNLCVKLSLLGRIIIAKEGINGTLEGTSEAIEEYIRETTTGAGLELAGSSMPPTIFSDIKFKISNGTGSAFPKLTVRARDEIVTLGRPEIFPTPSENGGKYLSAQELNDLYANGEDFVLLDMRNKYEYEAGRFDKSIVMPIRHFRELPEHKEKLALLKGKKVVAVCTGGVRCEKGTAYLKSEIGVQDVYQLHDGIFDYLTKYPEGYFRGGLYVFDGRVVSRTPEMLKSKIEVVGRCAKCSTQSELFVNCSNQDCREHFIVCKDCLASAGGENKILCNKESYIDIYT